MRERREIFEDFCRNAAEEHKRGKPDKSRAARDAFQALLKEAEDAEGGVNAPPPDVMDSGRPSLRHVRALAVLQGLPAFLRGIFAFVFCKRHAAT